MGAKGPIVSLTDQEIRCGAGHHASTRRCHHQDHPLGRRLLFNVPMVLRARLHHMHEDGESRVHRASLRQVHSASRGGTADEDRGAGRLHPLPG